MSNEEWYYYDKVEHKCKLTEKATAEAKKSYDEWYELDEICHTFPNICSEMKTDMCTRKIYDEDVMYCEYCGSLTTNAIDKLEEENK